MNKHNIIIDNHWYIKAHRNGIMLSRASDSNCKPSIKTIFDLPLQCYFYNLDSTILLFNDRMAEVARLSSTNDAINKSIHDLVVKKYALKLIKNNTNILNNKRSTILSECMILHDDEELLEGISIKCPWYIDGKLGGLFGCSVIVDSLKSYAEGVSLLAKTELLSLPPFLLRKANASHWWTSREDEIADLLVRGKSAKDIGLILGLSKRTIEHHLERMKQKTHTTTKSALIDVLLG